ncbi:MAG: hypothetical protein Kow0042_10040 [Calditrichia bacterium]
MRQLDAQRSPNHLIYLNPTGANQGKSTWQITGKVLFFILILVLLAGMNPVYSRDYLWPTTASRLLTSSFCEFRPRHYHAAIDIKTWNQTGYRVLAIEDGYVMRVRTSAFGYGKAVYLKLKDGNIVVYAHLERFWPALETYVDSYRLQHQQYRVDLYPGANEFPVKRGQLIGYSGKTGIGVPHLHFEIRDTNHHPINPLQFYRKQIVDRIPPHLSQIAFIPLEQQSFINLSSDTLIIDLGERRQVALPDTIVFSGQIGIALQSWDQADEAPNLFSFYRARMWLDDSLVYSVQYDRFSYALSHQIELDKNFSLWRNGRGIFHNFFVHPASRLPHYEHFSGGSGIIDSQKIPEGLHRLKIQVEDYWENSAVFELNFISGNAQTLSYDLNRRMEDEIFLQINSPVELSRIEAFRLVNPHGWQPLNTPQILSVLKLEQDYRYMLSLPSADSSADQPLKIQGFSPTGMPTFPLYISFEAGDFPRSSEPKLSPDEVRFRKRWIEIPLQLDRDRPFSKLKQLSTTLPGLSWFPLSSSQYCIQIPAEEFKQAEGILGEVISGKDALVFVQPETAATVLSSDGLFQADFPPGSLYQKSLVWLQSDSVYADSTPFLPEYPPITPIYDLQPFDEPIQEAVAITLKAPASLKELRGLGIYYWDRKKGWLFIPAQIDSIRGTFTANVTSLEKFTLLQDTIPPLIIPAQPVRGGVLQTHRGYASFLVKDEGSGIRHESQIQVYLNSRWHLFEYDPEEDLVLIKNLLNRSGKNILEISVEDNVGNRTKKEYIFH